MQISVSNLLYMEEYCSDLLAKLDCFNRVTLSLNLPAGDPKNQYLTNLGTIPRTNSPLNSLEFHADPSAAGICFDGSQINSHSFLIDWSSSEDFSLFCSETIRSLKEIAFEIKLATFINFQTIPSVFLEFSNLQRLTFEAPAKLNCTCEIATKFGNFAQQVEVDAICLQNDSKFSDWLLENYQKCEQEPEKVQNYMETLDSDLCKSECTSFFKTTISKTSTFSTEPKASTNGNASTRPTTNSLATSPTSSMAGLRIFGKIDSIFVIFYILLCVLSQI